MLEGNETHAIPPLLRSTDLISSTKQRFSAFLSNVHHQTYQSDGDAVPKAPGQTDTGGATEGTVEGAREEGCNEQEDQQGDAQRDDLERSIARRAKWIEVTGDGPQCQQQSDE